jgi:hypothetical protein
MIDVDAEPQVFHGTEEGRMKKLIASVLLASIAAGCRTSSTSSTSIGPVVSGDQTGAPDAASAVRGFLAAAKAQDLQGISAFWGDRDGTARRPGPPQALETRDHQMAGWRKPASKTLNSEAPAQSGGRTFVINLVKPGKSAAINFEAVPASDRRWYVQRFEIEKLMADYCKKS